MNSVSLFLGRIVVHFTEFDQLDRASMKLLFLLLNITMRRIVNGTSGYIVYGASACKVNRASCYMLSALVVIRLIYIILVCRFLCLTGSGTVGFQEFLSLMRRRWQDSQHEEEELQEAFGIFDKVRHRLLIFFYRLMLWNAGVNNVFVFTIPNTFNMELEEEELQEAFGIFDKVKHTLLFSFFKR